MILIIKKVMCNTGVWQIEIEHTHQWLLTTFLN